MAGGRSSGDGSGSGGSLAMDAEIDSLDSLIDEFKNLSANA